MRTTMPNLPREVARNAVALSALFACATSIAAEIEFTRINACADTAQVLRSVLRPATNCVSPTGVIEQTIRNGASGSSATLCFMERPPASSLDGFRCVQATATGAGNITCYRPASLATISEYKENYVRKYAAPTSAYMEAAKRCSGSNGQSSPTIETTFPPTLMPVSAHEFGFNVQYGNSQPGTALITHGFARTSPEVVSRGPEAIEYVSFSDGAASFLRPRTAVGNWRLQVDTSSDFFEPFRKMLRNQGLDAYLAAVDIDLKRAPLAPKLSKLSSLPEQLSDTVVSALEREDFEEMSDDDFKAQTGKSKNESTKEFGRNVFFGTRVLMNVGAVKFRLLMKNRGIQCTRNNRGAIGAYIFTLDGNPNMQADFGSISMLVVGFGACASSGGWARDYLHTLVDVVRVQLIDELGTR